MIPSGSAISAVAIGEAPSWAVTGFVQALVSAGGAAGSVGTYTLLASTAYFVTGDDDEFPLTPFLSTLRQNFTLEKSLLGGGDFTGVSISLGRIELDNLEGLYDADAADYAVDGERVVIKVGEIIDGRADYAGFYTVGEFIGERHHANETALTIDLRDKTYLLDVPARKSAVYAGTGNMEGGPEVAGKPKPWPVGWCGGVTAAPILPVENIDQVGDGPCEITACYDTGAAYDFTADVADLPALRAATLVPSQFATCNALGLARRGGRPFGPITYDVKGQDTSGNFIETTADILRHVILAACDIDESDLAANTFDLVNIQQPAARGYYFSYTSDETVLEFASLWMRGVLGYLNVDRPGKIEIALIATPSIVPSVRYDATQFLEITREPLPDVLYPPPQRVRVTFAHNWTPLDTVAGEVEDPERIAYLKEQYQIASSPTASVAQILQDYPGAKDPEPVRAFFRLEEDALEEAERQFEFKAGARILYRGTIPMHPFVHELGETIHVTKPRFELSDGKTMVLMSVNNTIESRSQEVVGML